MVDYTFQNGYSHNAHPTCNVTLSPPPPIKGGIKFTTPLNLRTSWDCFKQQNMVRVTLLVLDIAQVHLVWQVPRLAFCNSWDTSFGNPGTIL